MSSRRLRDRVPSAAPVGTGFLTRHRLVFDKIGRDGSGKCDIELTDRGNDRVFGVLFEIDGSEIPDLDRAEGLGYGYEKESVDVVTESGVRTALTYVADRKDIRLSPYCWYRAFVLAGATEHDLPADYVDAIRSVDCVPDPDPERRARNEALLSRES